ERQREGLPLSFPLRQHVSLFLLNALSRVGLIQGARADSLAIALVSPFNLGGRDARQPVEPLRAGNQQTAVLASRLVRDPSVGARLEIHRLLRDVAVRGAAILLVTSDIEEAVAVSDRLLVMRDGAIQGELLGAEKTQGQALRLATGTN